MELSFALVAEYGIQSVEGDLSAIRITEDIVGQRFPMVIPRLTFIASFRRAETDPMSERCVFRVTLGSEELIVANEVPVEFAGKPNARWLAEVSPIMVRAPGDMVFQLTQGEKTVAKAIVRITGVSEARTVSAPATAMPGPDGNP